MKRLLGLIITLFLTSKTFSQTDTKSSEIVGLSTPIAKLVIKDLIQGDAYKLENEELKKVIDLKDNNISLLNEKIILKDNNINNLEQIIKKKDEIIVLERGIGQEFLSDLKKQRRKTLFYRITTGVLLFGCGYLLIK